MVSRFLILISLLVLALAACDIETNNIPTNVTDEGNETVEHESTVTGENDQEPEAEAPDERTTSPPDVDEETDPSWLDGLFSFEAHETFGFLPFEARFSCIAPAEELTYEITFGDGTEVTRTSSEGLVQVSHTYEEWGKHTARCTVSDDEGNKHEAGWTTTTGQVPLFDAKIDIDVLSLMKIEYSCWGEGGVGEIEVLDVDFGDGTKTSEPTGVHTYAEAGDYDIRCRVRDERGSIKWADTGFEIHPPPIDPLAVSLDVDVLTGGEIEYACTVEGGSGLKEYEVDFGDGVSSTQAEGTHTYEEPGSFDISCTVEDGGGRTDSDSVEALIEEEVEEPVNVDDITVSMTTDAQGPDLLDGVITCSVSGSAAPAMWAYSATETSPGGGMSGSGSTVSGNGSLSRTFIHEFEEAGTYDTTCHAYYYSDESLTGYESVETEGTVTVGGVPPMPDDVVVDLEVAATGNLSINYTCSSNYDAASFDLYFDSLSDTQTIETDGSNTMSGSHTFDSSGEKYVVCVGYFEEYASEEGSDLIEIMVE